MKKLTILSLFFILFTTGLFAQESKHTYTLDQVIDLAREQSLDALVAKHRYRADYWEFRSFRAKYLPDLTLNTQFPQFNRAIKKYQNPDGSYTYIEDNVNTTTLSLDMYQQVSLTGGQLFVSTDLQRIDQFGDNRNYSYLSSPVRIGYRQPVLFYNEYKWEKKIEPLKYQEAKKSYLSNMENATIKAVSYFFDLILAQKNLEIAKSNYANADTLYKISKQRFEIGTIAENELMQMELSFLNAGAAMNESEIGLKAAKIRLRTYLGFSEEVDISLIPPDEVPALTIDVQEAVNMARENNPEMLTHERQLLQAQRDVARAKAEKGPNANLFASFGLTQKADDINNVYREPQDQQSVTLGLEVPILDWGQARGRYKMARSGQEVVKNDIQRSKMEFEQNVALNIMQFNLQDDQVAIKKQADRIADKRYEITKKRFLVGKVDVLDLNVASREKDLATRDYISSLRAFWSDYYNIRRITLYDFFRERELDAEYKEMVD
ncbi:MAG TPA: TolC family protein [Bacteroidales bacterium]|nr:TolC family protein [Bacteroidales bacterium]